MKFNTECMHYNEWNVVTMKYCKMVCLTAQSWIRQFQGWNYVSRNYMWNYSVEFLGINVGEPNSHL